MAGTKSGLTAEEIQRDQLYGLLGKAQRETNPYDPKDIESKIRAAEDFYEDNLNILWGKHKIISGARARGIVVNPDASVPEIEEPGYDYEGDFWDGNKWAHVDLMHRPVIPDTTTQSGITKYFLGFPTADKKLFEIPQEWIKANFKYGTVQLVPVNGAIYASFNNWFLAFTLGGINIPMILYIDYFAGLEKDRLRKDNAHLLEALKMRVVLFMGGILGNIRAEGLASRSLSLDGLSHSRGYGGGKYGPYSGLIQHYIDQEKEIRETFRNARKGPVMIFV